MGKGAVVVAAEVAARHPDRVDSAVLLDPAMHIDAAVAAERAELTCTDVSFGSADEAVEDIDRLARAGAQGSA